MGRERCSDRQSGARHRGNCCLVVHRAIQQLQIQASKSLNVKTQEDIQTALGRLLPNTRGQYVRCARRTDAPLGSGASAGAANRYSA